MSADQTGGGQRQVRRRVMIATACTTVVAHAFLLANDRTFWDGALYAALNADRDWAGTVLPFRDAGYPLQGLVNWAIGTIGGGSVVLAYRLVAISSLAISAVVVSDLCQRVANMAPRRAFFVGALFGCNPVFYMSVSAVNVLALFNLASFALGTWLLLTHPLQQRTPRGRGLLAIVLLFGGFTWRSFLVMFGPVMLLRTHARLGGEWRGLGAALRAVWADAWMYALPFVYVLLNGILFRQRGHYAKDNTFKGPRRVIGSAVRYGFEVLPAQLAEVALSPWYASAGALLIGVVVAAAAFAIARGLRQPEAQNVPRKRVAVFAVIAGTAAVFPYAMVGKVPAVEWSPFPMVADWTGRWLLLTPLPFALGAVVIVAWLARGVRRSAALEAALAALLLACNVAALNHRYRQWLLWGATDAAIVSELARHAPFERSPSARICFVLRSARDGDDVHRGYELAALFQEAWGGRVRDWFPADWDDGYSSVRQKQTRAHYDVFAGELPPEGRCTWTITATEHASQRSDIELLQSLAENRELAEVTVAVSPARDRAER